MCLITLDKTERIATEDIKVYKKLRTSMRSIYFNFKWEFDKLYKTKIKQSNERSTFDGTEEYVLSPKWEIDPNVFVFGEGFHSASTKERLGKEWFNEITVIATIPKGAKYIEGVTGLLISNQLIIKKEDNLCQY